MLVQRQHPASAPAYRRQCALLASQPFCYVYSFFFNPSAPSDDGNQVHIQNIDANAPLLPSKQFSIFINTIHRSPPAPSVSQDDDSDQLPSLAKIARAIQECAQFITKYMETTSFFTLVFVTGPDVCCRASTWQDFFFFRGGD